MWLSSVIVAVLSINPANALFPDCINGPLKNTTVCSTSSKPIDRAAALVRLFTLEEKFNNTGHASPGVPRLGLPPYTWWNEALHGVARSRGVTFASSGNFSYATSFPQPVLMAAAFNDELIRSVAKVIGQEARAWNNANRSGLDFWTPDINPFKDPRWGRGQETPGEDPFHVSSYVRALIAGLEGRADSTYKRVIATCKHFVGYDIEDWEGNERYGFDARISNQDMVEYYIPPFEACARDSNVGAFMCSYNAVNGVPTCADPWLLQTILRDTWGWTDEEQWVVSDCDAVENIFNPHNYTSTPEQAVAVSLNAGTDINCGTFYQRYLPSAYQQGLFNESTLDRALIRGYSSLIRAGYFDPPTEQPYRQLTFADVSTSEAQKLAYEAAVQGIVLLKSNGGLLPLQLDSNTSIALIGPWANATQQMQGNYYGIAPYLHSPLLAAQQHNITVNYAFGVGISGSISESNRSAALKAAGKSSIVIFAGGIDGTVEGEARDRTSIAWPEGQAGMIAELAALGKPMIVLQFGGGQVDSSAIAANFNISALLWGGYPGQDGGTAMFDVLIGKVPPAGRLPVTQYPTSYTDEVPMTDMSLRPSETSPGRTYKWYTGEPVYPFGFGMHYTKFAASIQSKFQPSYNIQDLVDACNVQGQRLTKCPFPTELKVLMLNSGPITSDYSALAFLSGEFGPEPRPQKALIGYQRLSKVPATGQSTANISFTLGELARVDERGDRILYPGNYTISIDVTRLDKASFELVGEESLLEAWVPK
ncbi:glycoside hydrolase family 3 protein [Patellaria atrata CBS 101060]|uniref:xylan 1,4-beta-xylosidase n=1 Tax=Patellaria atrata CBS 101060 TaxID=1346257 RepID=A0A9P4SGG8_9PEZI|nr:glycoside hydrolase family 3 protein [Patellaria atrata CBS 101060]